MSKIFTVLVACCLAISLAGCGDSSDKKDPGNNSAGDSSKLSRSFGTNCSSCHGQTGGGATARSIQGYAGSLSAFSAVVRGGKGSMPAFTSSSYSDSDMAADYSYLKSL